LSEQPNGEEMPEGETAAPDEPAKRRNPGRSVALALVALAVVLFVYHLFADRLTPYSSYGYVRAYLVAVGPEVSGAVLEVDVEDNVLVEQGDVLFRIDPRDYEIAVVAAEAQLAQAGQSIGANTAQVSAAQAAVSEAKANLVNAREQAARTLTLVEQGVYAAARADDANAELNTSIAQVQQAEANLLQAQEALGPEGEDNPLLQAALAELDRARLNLLRTTVVAPSLGVVTGLQLAPGEQARAGEAVMAFVDIREIWLVSYMTENNLGLVQPGDRIEIALDLLPGAVFPGTVQSLGLGVEVEDTTAGGTLPSGLPDRSITSNDLRFPMRVLFDPNDRPQGLRFGARASVIVYPTDSGLMNALGWLRMRLSSLWNYVD
jgi:multidrug resistance efflux pump